jgi:hypothetical protein
LAMSNDPYSLPPSTTLINWNLTHIKLFLVLIQSTR